MAAMSSYSPLCMGKGSLLQEELLCTDCALLEPTTPKKQHPSLIHVLITSLFCGTERAFVLGNCLPWNFHNLKLPPSIPGIAPSDLKHRRFMRSQGSLAALVLFYLHKYIWFGFPSVPLHSIMYKRSSYLVALLLQSVLKAPCAVAKALCGLSCPSKCRSACKVPFIPNLPSGSEPEGCVNALYLEESKWGAMMWLLSGSCSKTGISMVSASGEFVGALSVSGIFSWNSPNQEPRSQSSKSTTEMSLKVGTVLFPCMFSVWFYCKNTKL